MKHEFEVADFFMVRTPLLPFEEFSSLVVPGSETSRAQLSSRIRELYRRPDLNESLQVASQSLHERFGTWNPASNSAKDRKVGIALTKYLSRMAYRSTPFGLAAGVSWAPIHLIATGSDRSEILLAPTSAYRRHCRLDTGILTSVNNDLLSKALVRRTSRFFLNPTVVRHGDRWRYMEGIADGPVRRFQLSDVECTPYFDALLDRIGGRPAIPFSELVSEVRTVAPGASDEDAIQFVDLLVEQGLLLSDLEPRVTLGDPLTQFLSEHGTKNTSVMFSQLRKTHELCGTLNAQPVGEGAELTKQIESKIRHGLNQPGIRDLLQTDLHKPIRVARLAPELIEDISAGIEALLKLSPRTLTVLDQFKADFLRRYSDVEVPLLEVLDPDAGLGFGPVIENLPLLEGTQPFVAGDTAGAPDLSALAASRMLVREFERATRERLPEIVLDDTMLASLNWLGEPRVPDSFYVIASILPHGDAGKENERIAIKTAGLPGAALFGRFCTADEELSTRVRRFIQLEESLRPEIKCAEIVHLPDGRYGNVISRPQMRTWEIPIFGRASVPLSNQILLRDLFLSVKNDRVLLRWTRTGELVVPKLTSAHNTAHFSTPVYRFLGLLQLQDGVLHPFLWPSEFLSAKQLPRIVYRRCVLAPRRWNLNQADLAGFRSCGSEQAAALVAAYRAELGWPRFIELIRGTTGMCVDLDNSLSVDCLTAEMARETAISLRESFVPGPKPLVRGPEGSFCHELLFPFVRAKSTGVSRTEPPPAAGATVARHVRQVLPGENWLYLKIYAGPAVLERILTSHLPALLALLASRGLLTKWFFLRYKDPDPHLRIRLQGEPASLWEKGFGYISQLLQELRDKSLAERACIDTYDTEIERYGGAAAFPVSEQIFHADSECALDLIRGGHLENPVKRWKYVLYAVDRFWSVALDEEDARRALYQECADNAHPAWQRPEPTRSVLNQRFRDHRNELEELLFGNMVSTAVRDIVQERTAKLMPMVQRLRDFERSGMSRTLGQIWRSHVHLSVNRLCLDLGRAQEAVIYDLLARLYKGRHARAAMKREVAT